MDYKKEEIKTGRLVTMIETIVLNRLKDSLFRKKIVYTLCFVALCVIDWIKGCADGRIQMIAINCTGFIMAVIIFSAYHLRDFIKVQYLIWMGIFLLGGTLACIWGKENYLYYGKWITGILNVGVYGFIIIRLIYKLLVEKAFPKLHKGLFGVWCVMMLWMIISRNDALWPFCFFVMFGCFYLTDYSREELLALFEGMVNGVIIGFFLIQGAAFVFRAYDNLRYKGMYANPNMNGLFYLVSYCAFLCKWYELKQKKVGFVWRLLTVILAGAMYGFALLTQGKTTLLAMVVLTLVMLVFFALRTKKAKVRSFVKQGSSLVMAAVLSFPLVFGTVRYLPAVFHHPIWYGGEYDVSRVHSFDPIDSEKYIDWDEMLESSFGRILWFIDFSKNEEIETTNLAAVEETEEIRKTESTLRGSGESEKEPLLTDKNEISNPITLRAGIYQYYAERVNFMGHKEEENGLWLCEGYFAPHAHNIFLQIAFNFGIPVCIVFVYVVGRILALAFSSHKRIEDERIKYITLIACGNSVALVLFGMFEIDWHVGQNIFTLFFVGLYCLFRIPDLEKKE